MPPARWSNVACECGSEFYIEAFTYRVHPSHGTSRGPEEIRCLKCQKMVDPQTNRREAMIQQKIEELKELGWTEEQATAALNKS